MTRSDKRYIGNEIIKRLNTPVVRCSVQMNGREKTLPELVRVAIEDDFPELCASEREELSELIVKQAIHSRYPALQISPLSARLNLQEILLLSHIEREELPRSMSTVQKLIDVMEDNEDDRAETIAQALRIFKDIMQSQNEPAGVNY